MTTAVASAALPAVAQQEQAAGSGELVGFFALGAIALGAAIAVVMMRNPVHAALMLVTNLLAVAGIYALLEAPFLAVAQVIVYAGAIVVLFLFVIMLLGVSREERLGGGIPLQTPVGLAVGAALAVVLVAGVAGPFLGPEAVCGPEGEAAAVGAGEDPQCAGLAEANEAGNVRGVGEILFTDYVWPFEVTSALLVVAAVGAVVIGRRHEPASDLVDGAEPSGAGSGTGADEDGEVG